MLKKVFLAAALFVAMVGVSMIAAPSEAYACKSGCFKKAKASYGHEFKKRHAYKKACKSAYKTHHKGPLARLFKK
ncbi:MAG TPA: hypothetical protein VEW64_08270 [Methyloceanibacter sp.]|nr:hypothetical protein [Methyloceanibacter sp.]